MGGLDPKQMEKMMRQLGMKQTQLEADEVIIKRGESELVIEHPQVTMIEMQGQKTFQIVGEPHERRTAAPTFTDEDVQMVMEKTGKTEEEARNALSEVNGDIAEAILRLS